MNRVRLEDFRYPTRLDTSDPRWPTVTAWQKQGLVRIVPQTKTVAMVDITAAGLQRANREREAL